MVIFVHNIMLLAESTILLLYYSIRIVCLPLLLLSCYCLSFSKFFQQADISTFATFILGVIELTVIYSNYILNFYLVFTYRFLPRHQRQKKGSRNAWKLEMRLRFGLGTFQCSPKGFQKKTMKRDKNAYYFNPFCSGRGDNGNPRPIKTPKHLNVYLTRSIQPTRWAKEMFKKILETNYRMLVPRTVDKVITPQKK